MARMVDLGLVKETDLYDSRYLENEDKYHKECENEKDYDVTGFTPKGRELFECIYNEFVAPFEENDSEYLDRYLSDDSPDQLNDDGYNWILNRGFDELETEAEKAELIRQFLKIGGQE